MCVKPVSCSSKSTKRLQNSRPWSDTISSGQPSLNIIWYRNNATWHDSARLMAFFYTFHSLTLKNRRQAVHIRIRKGMPNYPGRVIGNTVFTKRIVLGDFMIARGNYSGMQKTGEAGFPVTPEEKEQLLQLAIEFAISGTYPPHLGLTKDKKRERLLPSQSRRAKCFYSASSEERRRLLRRRNRSTS